MAELLIPWARHSSGRMVEPLDVPNGADCDCTCDKCHRRVIARHGQRIEDYSPQPHFAHEADADCQGGGETAAHSMAKQIVAEAGYIHLPPLIGVAHHLHPMAKDIVAEAATRATITNIRIEPWIDGIRPDVIAEHDGKDVAIEFAVAHRCGPEKIAVFNQRRYRAIEISLSQWRKQPPTLDQFKHVVLHQAPRVWLFHPRKIDADALAVRRWKELEARRLALYHRRQLLMQRARKVGGDVIYRVVVMSDDTSHELDLIEAIIAKAEKDLADRMTANQRQAEATAQRHAAEVAAFAAAAPERARRAEEERLAKLEADRVQREAEIVRREAEIATTRAVRAKTPQGALIAEVEARRCEICGGHNAWFGFGPPLTRKTVWACGAHRKELDQRLISGKERR
jgi:hypothetical protein